jgi:TRAP-type transport system periplasmic protein
MTMNARIRIRTLGAALAAYAWATAPPHRPRPQLTLSSWVPSTHFVVTKDILQPWMADVKKATEGRVTINLLPKPVGGPAQHWELARRGVADITWGNFTYEPERFKHVWFAELPLMGDQSEAGPRSPCGAPMTSSWPATKAFKGVDHAGHRHAGRRPDPPPEQAGRHADGLKGQKVRMGGPIQKRLLEELGAIPVAGPGTKAYELLEGGVIDASLHPWSRWSTSASTASSSTTPSCPTACTTRPSSSA